MNDIHEYKRERGRMWLNGIRPCDECNPMRTKICVECNICKGIDSFMLGGVEKIICNECSSQLFYKRCRNCGLIYNKADMYIHNGEWYCEHCSANMVLKPELRIPQPKIAPVFPSSVRIPVLKRDLENLICAMSTIAEEIDVETDSYNHFAACGVLTVLKDMAKYA